MSKPNMLLTLQRRIDADPMAKDRDDWEDIPASQEWYAVRPLTGSETLEARQVKAMTTHVARCPMLSVKASPKNRLKAAGTGRIFEVESVTNEFERNRTLVWRLKETV